MRKLATLRCTIEITAGNSAQATLRYAVRASSLGSESLAECSRLVPFQPTAVFYTGFPNCVKLFVIHNLCTKSFEDAL